MYDSLAKSEETQTTKFLENLIAVYLNFFKNSIGNCCKYF